MGCFRRRCSAVRFLGLIGGLHLCTAGQAWAQEITEPAGKSYTLMYLLVVLCLALGLLGIMRPSRRAKQQRPQKDG